MKKPSYADKFAPLTEVELAAVPAGDGPAQDIGECIMPIPANAPPRPSSHFTLGKSSAHWEYRSAEGELLFLKLRFDLPGGGKEMRPLSLWREPSGALRWHWKAVHAPRPLYGLDQLAAKPDAPIVARNPSMRRRGFS